MCVCVWEDIWPSKKITRLLSGYAAILQILIATLILYVLIKEDRGPIALGIAITLFCLLFLLACLLIFGIWKQHKTILKVYFLCFAILGIATIIFLMLNAFHLIDWRNGKLDKKCWLAYLSATAFTGIYAYSIGVLYFYISYLNDDEQL